MSCFGRTILPLVVGRLGGRNSLSWSGRLGRRSGGCWLLVVPLDGALLLAGRDGARRERFGERCGRT